MPVKAKAGDGGGLLPHLFKVPEGIVGTAIDGVRRVVMLTGDNRRAAAAITQQAGLDEFHAELLPKDKVRVLESLKEIGPVAMVGDGVKDAPALATAAIGIAMGAADTDVLSQWFAAPGIPRGWSL